MGGLVNLLFLIGCSKYWEGATVQLYLRRDKNSYFYINSYLTQ